MHIKGDSRDLPSIILGCMRIHEKSDAENAALIQSAIEQGINFFDHADIYGRGESERIFARVAKTLGLKRENLILQSKSAIKPGIAFDCSKEYIIESVEHILHRLNTDYLDYYLLHRPDALMDAAEVAEAFDRLRSQGKVKHFGVSNQNTHQMQLLNHITDHQIVVNQLQLSIAHCPIIDTGLNVNMNNHEACDRDGGILPYCQKKNIALQAWSPFQYGFFEGVFLGNAKFAELNLRLEQMSEYYQAPVEAIATAWLLRLPVAMQVIVGTTNPERLTRIAQAARIRLSREDWYALYLAAGKKLP